MCVLLGVSAGSCFALHVVLHTSDPSSNSTVDHLLFAAHINDVMFDSVETPAYLESSFCCFYAKQGPLLT